MRLCKCGGVLAAYPLTGGREAWACKACKRYEIVQPPSLVKQPNQKQGKRV